MYTNVHQRTPMYTKHKILPKNIATSNIICTFATVIIYRLHK